MKLEAPRAQVSTDLEEGTYPGTVWKVEDSTWPAGNHGFGDKPERPAVVITAVLDDIIDPETGENALVDAKITASNHEKATLTKWAKGLLGKNIADQPFDTEELMAMRGLFTVEKNNGGYPHITNVTALPKSMAKKPEAVTVAE